MRIIFQLAVSIFTILTAVAFVSAPALAAKPAVSKVNFKPAPVNPVGNDISWPQCNKAMPKGQLFGIVGVNNGLANGTNPCFAAELAWASASAGGTGQPKAALYVNTANPGNLGVADWPKTGTPNQYGTCDGSDNQACAYQYGWNMAQADAQTRISANNPSQFKWWLDVETENSWEANTANNVADLEGMTAYFESQAAQVGLYSTAAQWKQIAGTSVSPTSNLNGLSSWLPGARSLSNAKSNCSLPALTFAGTVSMTQYVSAQTDYDYSCV